MKFVIIGFGYFGKIIFSKLKGEVTIVDPFYKDSDYDTVSEVPFTDGKWFITSPASTHYKVICELFDKGVRDIWVEKPICSTLEETLDVFAKIPDGVFLYCDFTWLKHSAILKMGEYVYEKSIQHLELKWLNDGTHVPGDVNIVMDLVVHPISIVTYLFFKNKDVIQSVTPLYTSEKSVVLTGKSSKGCTFNIEVSNNSKTKLRTISVYSEDSIRWNSSNEFHLENIGKVDPSDAIENNIECFLNGRGNPVFCLDISRTLECINKQLSS
jgi:predicted dehydrogenase